MSLRKLWTAVLGGLAVLVLVNSGSASEATPLPAPLVLAQGSLPQFDSSYGYQPYNDRNPTGFFHPNGMGYGHYYLPPKQHGHRFKALRYRKFKGY